MELFDLESLNIGPHVLQLIALGHTTNREENYKEAQVDAQSYVVVSFSVFASWPITDFDACAMGIELLVDTTAAECAIGVLVADGHFSCECHWA